MIVVIAAAEVAFWIFLGAGLAARYLLHRPALSRVLLWAVPLVDLTLLVVVAVDVIAGGRPDRSHALAAIYLGVTVGFGRHLIRWADARFAHRFAGAPAPVKPAKGSEAQVRALWSEWARVLLASGIASVLLLIMNALAGLPLPTSSEEIAQNPYLSAIWILVVVSVIWFLAGPAFASRKRPSDEPARRARDADLAGGRH